jgi:hypothetical protein
MAGTLKDFATGLKPLGKPDFQRPAVWSLGQKQLLVEPRSDIVDRLDSLEIKVIWREKKVFLDNMNGQFT